MAKNEFDINKFAPNANVGYSGNPLDPVKVQINAALGRFGVLPPYFLPKQTDIITSVQDVEQIKSSYYAGHIIHSLMPMRIRLQGQGDNEWFTLPFEPLVSLSAKNIITRRSVAKSKQSGTIKERWTQDDYEVSIKGVITNEDEAKYPKQLMRTLREFFDERQSIEVDQDILLLFGIKFLAIESINLPHTKGINNQNYDIKAYSDNPVELLISL